MVSKFTYRLKKNGSLHFISRLLQFIAMIAILDFVTGYLLDYYYFRQTSGLQYRTTFAVDSTKADLLVFGSSRANHHYHPDVFRSRLSGTYYNAGRNGNFIYYNYSILSAALKRYTPKTIILDVVDGEFAKTQASYDRIASLLPYYRTHPEMRPVIEMKSPYEKIKLLSRIYPFNSSIFTIAIGNTVFNKARVKEQYGYVPLTDVLDPDKQHRDDIPVPYETDSIKVKLFEAFVRDCIKSGVKLYLVCSPYYSKQVEKDFSIRKAKEIAAKYNIDFLDYSNDPNFYNKAPLFADAIHLNDTGARLFSKMITDKMLAGKQ